MRLEKRFSLQYSELSSLKNGSFNFCVDETNENKSLALQEKLNQFMNICGYENFTVEVKQKTPKIC